MSVAYLVDEKKYSRKKAVLIMASLVYLAAIPCALSFNLLSEYTLNFPGKAYTFFDIADYLASNLLLPLGGFFLAIFAGYIWGIDEVVKNLLQGNSDSRFFSNKILKNKNSILFIEFVVKSIVIPIVFIVLLNLIGVF